MFYVWVRTLAKCNIVPARDENGNDVPETLKTVQAHSGPTVTNPAPFNIRFVPRNKQ